MCNEVTHRVEVEVALSIVREFNILATSEKIAKAVAEDHMWREINAGLSTRTDIQLDLSDVSSETTSRIIEPTKEENRYLELDKAQQSFIDRLVNELASSPNEDGQWQIGRETYRLYRDGSLVSHTYCGKEKA